MTTLQIAAQQALEALDLVTDLTNHDDEIYAAITALRAALAQEQAEPLNLLDRAVQRRLAAQWGYVPAEQAEPAQKTVVRGAAYADALRSAIKACGAVQRDDGVWFGDDAAAKLARVLSEGIAPPRRTMVPLTEKEIMGAFHAARNAKLGASQDNSKHRLSVLEIARLVEKASWEKNHG